MNIIQRNDWTEVANRFRRGDYQLRDHPAGLIFQGPIESIVINQSYVVITLKWIAQKIMKSQEGENCWVKAPDAKKVIRFPNNFMPFIIENTMNGPCVCCDFISLYLDAQSVLDPKLVNGLKLQ